MSYYKNNKPLKAVVISLIVCMIGNDAAGTSSFKTSHTFHHDALQAPTVCVSPSLAARGYLEGMVVSLLLQKFNFRTETENLTLIPEDRTKRVILALKHKKEFADKLVVPIFIVAEGGVHENKGPSCQLTITNEGRVSIEEYTMSDTGLSAYEEDDETVFRSKRILTRVRTTDETEPDLPPSFRFYKTPIDRIPGHDREKGRPAGGINIPLPADIAKKIKRSPDSTMIAVNGAASTVDFLKEQGDFKVSGTRTDHMEETSLEYRRVHMGYRKGPDIKDGRAFIRTFEKEHPGVERLIFVMDEMQYDNKDDDTLAPLLYLVPHRFLCVEAGEGRKTSGDGKRRIYLFIIDTKDLSAFKAHRVSHYLWENPKPKTPEKAVYTDAVVDKGRILSGTLVPRINRKYLPPAIIKHYPHIVLDNCRVTEKTGYFAVRKEDTILQWRTDLVGTEFMAIVDHGKVKSLVFRDGEEFYREAGPDTENAVFTDYVLDDGKLVSGKFYAAYPSRMYVEQLPDDCVIRNVRCDDTYGGLYKLNYMFWKQRRGYEGYPDIMMVRKNKKVIQIFDGDGKLLWFDPNEVQGFDMRKIHIGAEYSDGKIKGGRIVFASESGIPFKELQKYPDCIISGLTTSEEGALSIGDRNIFRYGDLRKARDLTAIRKTGRIIAVYDASGNEIYTNTTQTKNAVYSYCYLKNGRFIWNGFYRAFPGGVGVDILRLMPNCAIANVEVNANKGVSVAHEVFVQNMPSIENRKDIVCIFHEGEPLALCDPEGNILRIVNEKSLSRIELEQSMEALKPRAAVELIRTFGLVHAFTIISRAYNLSTPAAREIVLGYFEELDKKERDDIRKKTKRKIDIREFCGNVRKIFDSVELKPTDAQWLSLILTDTMYSYAGSGAAFRKTLESEMANKKNPYCLKLAYKKVLREYKDTRLDRSPESLKKELFLFQKSAVRFIKEHKRVLLADESGLGKTYTSIAAALSCKEKGARKILIVSPKSAVDWWGKEIIDSTNVPRGRVYMHKTADNPSIEDARFVIVNYEAIRGKRNRLRAELAEQGFDFIIVDEAHKMRNDSALQTEAVMQFDSEFKLLVSATPLVGRKVKKLFPLLHWLNPEIFADKGSFLKKYSDNPGLLRRHMSTMMISRMKADVQPGIPPRKYIDEYVPMTAKGKKIYDEVLAMPLESFAGTNRPARKLAKLEVLKQAAIAPIASASDTRHKDFKESAKCARACEIAAEKAAAKEKVVIFTRYLDVALNIRNELSSLIPGDVLMISGQHKSASRQAQIERFKNDPDANVLVITYGVGGESLNLQSARNIILVDYPWTYQEMVQAIDRVHRIGQKYEVNVYRLIAKGTIDEYILNVSKESEDIHRLIIRGENIENRDEEEQMVAIISEKLGIEKNAVEKARKRYVESEARKLMGGGRVSVGNKKRVLTEKKIKGTNIHPSVGRVTVFDDESKDKAAYDKKTDAVDKGACRLSEYEERVVKSVLKGYDAEKLIELYTGVWIDILKSAMIKLGVSDLSELRRVYSRYRKMIGKQKGYTSLSDPVRPGKGAREERQDHDQVVDGAGEPAEESSKDISKSINYTPADVAETKLELSELEQETAEYIDQLMQGAVKDHEEAGKICGVLFEYKVVCDTLEDLFVNMRNAGVEGLIESIDKIEAVKNELGAAFREMVFPKLTRSKKEKWGDLFPASLLGCGIFGSLLASPIVEEIMRTAFIIQWGWPGFAVFTAINIIAHAKNIRPFIELYKKKNGKKAPGITDIITGVFFAPAATGINTAAVLYFFSCADPFSWLTMFAASHVYVNIVLMIVNLFLAKDIFMPANLSGSGHSDKKPSGETSDVPLTGAAAETEHDGVIGHPDEKPLIKLPPLKDGHEKYRILVRCRSNLYRSQVLQYMLREYINMNGWDGYFEVLSGGTNEAISKNSDLSDKKPAPGYRNVYESSEDFKKMLEYLEKDGGRNPGLGKLIEHYSRLRTRRLIDEKDIKGSDIVLTTEMDGEGERDILVTGFLPYKDEFFNRHVPDLYEGGNYSYDIRFLYKLFEKMIRGRLGRELERIADETVRRKSSQLKAEEYTASDAEDIIIDKTEGKVPLSGNDEEKKVRVKLSRKTEEKISACVRYLNPKDPSSVMWIYKNILLYGLTKTARAKYLRGKSSGLLAHCCPQLLEGIGQSDELLELARRFLRYDNVRMIKDIHIKGNIGPEIGLYRNEQKYFDELAESDPGKADRGRRLFKEHSQSKMKPGKESFAVAAELGEIFGYSNEDILLYGLKYFPKGLTAEDFYLLALEWEQYTSGPISKDQAGNVGDPLSGRDRPADKKKDTSDLSLREVLRNYIGDISDSGKLARSLISVIRSYLTSGKRLIIAAEEGLGGDEFGGDRLLSGLKHWKEKLVNRNEKLKVYLDNLVILPAFRDADELRRMLQKEGISYRDEAERDRVFVFAKNGDNKAAEISSISASVRTVMVNEPDGMEDAYYPLAELVTFSLLKELLNLDADAIVSMLAENGIKLPDFNIGSIADDKSLAAFLIISLVPKIMKYDADEFRGRYSRLLAFIRHA